MNPDQLSEVLNRGFRFALTLTHDRDRAQDLVQDAWLSIYKRGATPNKSYLFRTIRNRFIDLYRRQKFLVFDSMDVIENTAANEAHLSSQVDEEVLADLSSVDAALSELRPMEREALYLFAVEGFTAQEIADMTERPRGTILSLVHRARKKLVSALEACPGTLAL